MNRNKRLFCILLCVAILFNSVMIPSDTVYAGGGGGTHADGCTSYTWKDYVKYYGNEASKFVLYMGSQLIALKGGKFDQIMKNFDMYINQMGSGEVLLVDVNEDTGETTYSEDLINLLKDYFDSLKDSSGNYPADSGIETYEFQWIKTNTNRKVWEDYYEAYASNYDDADVEKIGDYDSFLKRFSDYFALSPISFGGMSLHPSEPQMLFVVPAVTKKNFYYTECASTYSGINKNVWFYCWGHVTAENNWSLTPGCLSSVGEISGSPEFYRSVNENGKLNDFNLTPQNLNTFNLYQSWDRSSVSHDAEDCGSYWYIDSLGTPDGRYIRLFKTQDDAVAYYNATQGCNLPSYPYAGGNVTIINGDVNYGDPDKPLNPDGPGGENPGTGDYGGWLQKIYQKLCEIKDQLFIGNVISALDLLNDIFNNYIKKAGAVVSSVTETASNKFPFCIPVVIVAGFKLMDASAPPSVPPSEKYSPETGGGGGNHAGSDGMLGSITGTQVTFRGTAPVFTVPLEFKSLNVSYTFTMDFTLPMWSAMRAIVWYITYFYVFIFLINVTLKLVAAMKEG